ncbi:MAG TPA: hypothetical protein VEW03_06770 [Longimicrobiaceae bacterium]|nr:hypothetical protein [Longimicrobiaceae bacterium]
MLSPWPERRRGGRYGGPPRPPSLIRLVLFLLAVLAAIYWLLRSAPPAP